MKIIGEVNISQLYKIIHVPTGLIYYRILLERG